MSQSNNIEKEIKLNDNLISKTELYVIIGLVVSVLWIFIGLDFGFSFEGPDDIIWQILTLGGLRHTIMTILALILIPMCAKGNKYGFLAAMILGMIIFILCFLHYGYMLIFRPDGFESKLFGPIMWSIIQIPIVIYSYKVKNQK